MFGLFLELNFGFPEQRISLYPQKKQGFKLMGIFTYVFFLLCKKISGAKKDAVKKKTQRSPVGRAVLEVIKLHLQKRTIYLQCK